MDDYCVGTMRQPEKMKQNEGGLGLIKVSKFIEFIELNVTATLSLLMKILLVDTRTLYSTIYENFSVFLNLLLRRNTIIIKRR